MTPTVSVVLPVRDGEPYIGEAVASILAQTHRPLELLVVDDRSSDGSRDIVMAAAERDPRVRLLDAAGTGISAALNTGFAAAQAPWVARMDADDIAMPHRLERQLEAAAAQPAVMGWSSWATAIDGHGRPISRMHTGPVDVASFEATLADGHILEVVHSTMMVRRDVVVGAGGYDSRFDGAEDVELWDRIAVHGPILTIPEPLMHCRVHGDSYSTRRLVSSLLIHDYVAERRQAHNRGETLSYAQFLEQRRHAPGWRRLARRLVTRGRVLYRAAGVRYAAGQPVRTALLLSGALLLAPRHTVAALRRQVGGAVPAKPLRHRRQVAP